MTFICYDKCSTCKKAQNWLDAQGKPYTRREIKAEPPTEAELRAWVARSGLPLKRFWNTSGQQYRALGLKDKLADMSEDAQLRLLASDPMLVRRPLLIGEGFAYPGFRQEEWEAALCEGPDGTGRKNVDF